jgi:multimeric flavodoxin WrbA
MAVPIRIAALYGSPRRNGNTARLAAAAVVGAREAGAEVEELRLRELELSPCLEIYGCKKDGRCVIRDEFNSICDRLLACDGYILATPVFFYTVSAHTKIFMDRFQCRWVKKYWLDGEPPGAGGYRRLGLLIAAGATKGKRLFDGIELTARYFFDTLDAELWRTLGYRGLDGADDIIGRPEYLAEARAAGGGLIAALLARREENAVGASTPS